LSSERTAAFHRKKKENPAGVQKAVRLPQRRGWSALRPREKGTPSLATKPRWGGRGEEGTDLKKKILL